MGTDVVGTDIVYTLLGALSSFYLQAMPACQLQIVTLNAGAIIGDITVLQSVTKRTASVIATGDLVRVLSLCACVHVCLPLRVSMFAPWLC